VESVSIRLGTDVTPRDPDIQTVLSLALPASRVETTVTRCIADGLCLIAVVGRQVAGCLCASSTGVTGEWVIDAVAVETERQLRGVGRLLIREGIARTGAKVFLAETDGDAAQFYAQCGSAITSLGEKYPGVERFACRWSR
jgi:hypothetical protein